MKDRLYCPHKIESSRAPLPGGVAMTRLALEEGEIVDLTARGIEVEACGGFICQRQTVPGPVTCARCLGSLCHCCSLASTTAIHTCPPTKPFNPLKTLVRGVDDQICLHCRLPSQLGSGCNTITCVCKASFCFICGVAVDHESSHWTEGSKCPRFGQPGTKGAVWDWAGQQVGQAVGGRFVRGVVLPEHVFAGRLVVEDEFEQKFFVELGRFQEAVRERLKGGRVASWTKEEGLADVEAVFELSLLREARFSGLKPTSGRAAKQKDLLKRLELNMNRFFSNRNDLLRDVLQDLLPAGFYRLPRADEAILQDELDGIDADHEGTGTGSEDQKEEEDDDDEDDLTSPTFPTPYITAAPPHMLYPYTITIPLSQLSQTYNNHDKNQEQDPPLPPRGVEGTATISFRGDIDEPWIERACIKELELSVEDKRNRTREFWEWANERSGLLADLVQVIIS